jgi:hypothetical protein
MKFKVVNNIAERGITFITLVQSFNSVLAKYEDQK